MISLSYQPHNVLVPPCILGPLISSARRVSSANMMARSQNAVIFLTLGVRVSLQITVKGEGHWKKNNYFSDRSKQGENLNTRLFDPEPLLNQVIHKLLVGHYRFELSKERFYNSSAANIDYIQQHTLQSRRHLAHIKPKSVSKATTSI